LFNSCDHIVPFLDYLNSKHPNIKFAFQIENDDKTLPFLDISIKNVLMGILKLLFIENQPLLIFLQILKVFLPTLILQNGYPKFFIGRCIKTFLDKMISPPPKVQTPTVSK
jgi:hypothetical protein